jgi:hypothetical protein
MPNLYPDLCSFKVAMSTGPVVDAQVAEARKTSRADETTTTRRQRR